MKTFYLVLKTRYTSKNIYGWSSMIMYILLCDNCYMYISCYLNMNENYVIFTLNSHITVIQNSFFLFLKLDISRNFFMIFMAWYTLDIYIYL